MHYSRLGWHTAVSYHYELWSVHYKNIIKVVTAILQDAFQAWSSHGPTLSPLAHRPLTSISTRSSSSYVTTNNGAFTLVAGAGGFTGGISFIGLTTGMLRSVWFDFDGEAFSLAFSLPFDLTVHFAVGLALGSRCGVGELLLPISPRTILEEIALGEDGRAGVMDLVVRPRVLRGDGLGEGVGIAASSSDEQRSITADSMLGFVLARVARRVVRCGVGRWVMVFLVTADRVRVVLPATCGTEAFEAEDDEDRGAGRAFFLATVDAGAGTGGGGDDSGDEEGGLQARCQEAIHRKESNNIMM